MVRMEVDDYCNQQESIEDKKKHCCICGIELNNEEEYICEICYDKQMVEEQNNMELIRQEEYNSDIGENWRFTDNRGRSVFRREL